MGDEVQQIKERLNIADVVGEYVQLKPAGQNLKALCPFHQEKSPSFIVSPGRGTWHCFGCNEGGDHYSFIQKVEGVDFPAALKMLAERAGITLQRGVRPETTSHRQRQFDLLRETARLYHEFLLRHEGGKEAREYLLDRGLQEETWKQLQIGFAPHRWDFLQQWLAKRGYSMQEMEAAGVVGKSQRGTYFDRFRGRIIFPINDTQGRTVAFGGRIVPWHETGNEGKYVNSPETALYEKREVVYNLDRARTVLRQNQPCLVVEGYMDVAMLLQTGVENVVASSGTAFTEGHIKQLARFTKELHFAFDADAAGWKATVGATEAALLASMRVATVVLPAGKDPADLAKEQPEAVKEMMGQTQPLIEVVLEQLSQGEAGGDPEGQLQAALGLVRHVKNPIQQGDMVGRIAACLHIPEARILQLLEEQARHFVTYQEAEAAPGEGQDDERQGAGGRVEQQFLGVLMKDTAARQELFPQLAAEFFLDREVSMLYNELQELALGDTRFFDMTAIEMVDALPERQQPMAEGVLTQAEELLMIASEEPIRVGQSLWVWLKRRHLRGQLHQVQERLASGSEGERIETLQQFQTLAQELSALDRV